MSRSPWPSREATGGQVRRAADFLAGGRPDAAVTDAAWTQYAEVLLGSNEFLFID